MEYQPKEKGNPGRTKMKTIREFPQKKHKLCFMGGSSNLKLSLNPKAQTCCIQNEPSAYAAGSLEEQWYLEIVDKGSVSCPACQVVGRKTTDSLKKHMETANRKCLLIIIVGNSFIH